MSIYFKNKYLEESDTSMTKGLDEELSVDEEDPEDTIDILNDARESLNINTNQNKQAQSGLRKGIHQRIITHPRDQRGPKLFL